MKNNLKRFFVILFTVLLFIVLNGCSEDILLPDYQVSGFSDETILIDEVIPNQSITVSLDGEEITDFTLYSDDSLVDTTTSGIYPVIYSVVYNEIEIYNKIVMITVTNDTQTHEYIVEGISDFSLEVANQLPELDITLKVDDVLVTQFEVTYDDTYLDLNTVGKYPLFYSVTYLDEVVYSDFIIVTILPEEIVVPLYNVLGLHDINLTIGDTLSNPDIIVLEDKTLLENYTLDIDDSLVDYNTLGNYPLFYSITYNDTEIYTDIVTLSIVEENIIDRYPQILGTTDLKVLINGDINYLDGISVTDPVYGDITERLIINDSSVNLNEIGTYTVDYYVENIDGYQDKVTINVEVVFLEDFYTLPSNYFIVRINDLYGIKDLDNNTIVPIEYDDITYYEEGIIKLSKDDNFVYYNLNLLDYVEYDYEPIEFNQGISTYTCDNYYGYISIDNEIITPCIYSFATKFYDDGYAKVGLSIDSESPPSSYGYINQYGEVVIDIIYKNIGPLIPENNFLDNKFIATLQDDSVVLLSPDNEVTMNLTSSLFEKLSIGEKTYYLISVADGQILLNKLGNPITLEDEPLYYVDIFTEESPNTIYLFKTQNDEYFKISDYSYATFNGVIFSDFSLLNSYLDEYYVYQVDTSYYLYDNNLDLVDDYDILDTAGFTEILYRSPYFDSYIYSALNEYGTSVLLYLYYDTTLNTWNVIPYSNMIKLDEFIIFNYETNDPAVYEYTTFNKTTIDSFTGGMYITFDIDEYYTLILDPSLGATQYIYLNKDGTLAYPMDYQGSMYETDYYTILTKYDPLGTIYTNPYVLYNKDGDVLLESDHPYIPISDTKVLVYKENASLDKYKVFNILNKYLSDEYFSGGINTYDSNYTVLSNFVDGVDEYAVYTGDNYFIPYIYAAHPVVYEESVLVFEETTFGSTYVFQLKDGSTDVFTISEEFLVTDTHYFCVDTVFGGFLAYNTKEDTWRDPNIAFTPAKVEEINEEWYIFYDDFDNVLIYNFETNQTYDINPIVPMNYLGSADDYIVFGTINEIIYYEYDDISDSFDDTIRISTPTNNLNNDYYEVLEEYYLFSNEYDILYYQGVELNLTAYISDAQSIIVYDDDLFLIVTSIFSQYDSLLERSETNEITVKMVFENDDYLYFETDTGRHIFGHYVVSTSSNINLTYLYNYASSLTLNESDQYFTGTYMGTKILYVDNDYYITSLNGFVKISIFDDDLGYYKMLVEVKEDQFDLDTLSCIYNNDITLYLTNNRSFTINEDTTQYISIAAHAYLDMIYLETVDTRLIYTFNGLIINDVYNEINPLNGGYYYTQINDQLVIFDMVNEYLRISSDYIYQLPNLDQYIVYRSHDLYGVIDLQANIITPALYTEIGYYNGYIYAKNVNVYTVYDLDANKLLDEFYHEIIIVSE